MFALILLLLSAEQPTNAGQVILPKKEFVVEGKEELNLEEVQSVLSQENKTEKTQIDVEKLTDVRVREEVKKEIEPMRTQKGFSLGAFSMSYGFFNSISVKSVFGKDVGKVNYLITYSRQRRSDVYTNRILCPNTSYSEDSLSADFLLIPSLSSTFEIGGEFFDRYHENGIKSMFVSEERREFTVSGKFKTGGEKGTYGSAELLATPVYFKSKTSSFDYYEMSSKSVKFNGEVGYIWSTENRIFLKGRVEYEKFESQFDAKNLWRGGMVFEDVFPVGDVSIKVGVCADFETSQKGLVYPMFFSSLKFKGGSVEAGFRGFMKNLNLVDVLRENSFYQGFYPFPERVAEVSLAFDYLLFREAYLKLRMFYRHRTGAIEMVSDSSNVCEFRNVEDVNEFEVKGEFRWKATSWLSFGFFAGGVYSSSYLPYRPVRFEPFLSVRKSGLKFKVSSEFVGKQRSSFGGNYDIDKFVNLAVKMSYSPSDVIEMSVEANNLLSEKVKIKPWLPYEPLSVSGGIEIKW